MQFRCKPVDMHKQNNFATKQTKRMEVTQFYRFPLILSVSMKCTSAVIRFADWSNSHMRETIPCRRPLDKFRFCYKQLLTCKMSTLQLYSIIQMTILASATPELWNIEPPEDINSSSRMPVFRQNSITFHFQNILTNYNIIGYKEKKQQQPYKWLKTFLTLSTERFK